MAERDPRFKEELRARAARLYRNGKDLDEVAEILGVSKARAYVLCLEGGAKMRSRGPH